MYFTRFEIKITLVVGLFFQLLYTVDARGGGGRGGGGGGGRGMGSSGSTGLGVATGFTTGLLLADLATPNYYYSYSYPYIPPPVIASPPVVAPPPAVAPPAPQPPSTPPPTPPPPSSVPFPLTIYYDAMDTDSQRFLNKTLLEQFTAVSTLVDINFMPCQLAKENNGDFSCPTNSDKSCTLNKIHSCAINQITDKMKLVPYLACTTSSSDKLPDFPACATKTSVDDRQLQSCANSDQGKNLVKDYLAKKSPGKDDLYPKFVLKRPNDIKPQDPYDRPEIYISEVCATDLQSGICAQLKIINPALAPEECNKKLLMGIFYKTMDEKSQKWIQSFAQIYEKFADHLIVKFQPCMFVENIEGGKLDCKDVGDPDCISAKTHACAISLIQDPKLLFQFLKCATQDATKLPNFEKCASDNKIPFDVIKSCAESPVGQELCHDFCRTRPNSEKIPSFVYGLTFDEKASESTSAATDLKPILCEQLRKSSIVLPPDCL